MITSYVTVAESYMINTVMSVSAEVFCDHYYSAVRTRLLVLYGLLLSDEVLLQSSAQ